MVEKIIDYTAEEGYYTIKNDSAPSMFNGSLKCVIAETFDRFKFGGVTPQKQQVFYINLQEIKGIKFGTSSPLNYFYNFYNAELFLRAHGTYLIHITIRSYSIPMLSLKTKYSGYLGYQRTVFSRMFNRFTICNQPNVCRWSTYLLCSF